MRPGLRWRLADLGRAFKDALFASPEGAQPMEPLRGTARRVIVVPSPDPRVFEQAVFIVSDDYLHTPGKSQTELLRRARKQLPMLTAATAAVLLTLTLLMLTGHI